MKRFLVALLLVVGLVGCQSVEPARKEARGRFIEPRTVFVGQPFWSIWPPYDPRWGKAAIIHDELYKLKGRYPGRTYTRRESDLVFLEAMNDLGAGYFTRHTMFNCVRVFNSEWK